MTLAEIKKLPMVRLRYGPRPDDHFECHYYNAPKGVQVPWQMKHFKPNGVGLPLACGGSNAIRDNDHLFPHPVHLVYTIDSATYIVVRTNPDGSPLLACRYGHRNNPIFDVYDQSNDKPGYRPLLAALLDAHPMLSLTAGRVDKRPAGSAHGTGGGQHPRKSRGLVGHARRMARAGVLDKSTLARVEGWGAQRARA